MDVMPYQCTWWELAGQTDWREFADGTRYRTSVFRSLENGEEKDAKDLPIGALYATPRKEGSDPNHWPPAGHDGLSIVCKMPDGGHWYIESRASNCTMKDDDVHRCWVRHGTVGDKLTIDKNGYTCEAGAGSIVWGAYHGFLQNGALT
jgi:hypothetical protein